MPAPRVAFQGEAGAFSEAAARRVFGGDVITVPCPTFAGIAEQVLAGDAGYGMLPVENSIAGGVGGGYDVLSTGRLAVVGEVVEPIGLCVLGVPGAGLAEVRRVLSHPVALAQCQRFLDGLVEADALAVHDTAGAARLVAERGDRATVAVAGRFAAELYGLAVLAEDVQDRPDNQTRFFVVAAPGTPPPPASAFGSPRTALLFSTAHRPGALSDVLAPLAAAGINLSRIESRPADAPWHYNFFLELDADLADPVVATAVEQASRAARSLTVLGSFRRMG
ncbi:MAG TPA: prephenate dehydratase [Longimicrobiales bacterium]|nr:prephenate dehydratase [Longimicrobiales bacterium]